MVQRGGLASEAERSAEQPRLLVSLPRQLRAADSPRETEVIAYQGTGARLPAEGLPFYDHRAKPLGGAIDPAARPAGPAPMITRSKSRTSDKVFNPNGEISSNASTISALSGSTSTSRSNTITTGSRAKVLSTRARSSRPSFESAEENACGIPLRLSTCLSS